MSFTPSESTITVPLSSFFFFIFIAIPSCFSQVMEEHYYNCVDGYNCGQHIHNLTYPFWGNGRPQFCGHPQFELTCHNDDYTSISLDARLFRVLAIDQSTLLMTIARSDIWESYCVQGLRNVSLDPDLFQFRDNVQNLSIFYDCSYDDTRLFRINFTCPFNGRESRGFYAVKALLRDWIEDLSTACDSGIDVPVLREGLEDLSNSNQSADWKLKRVLNQGFEVDYLGANLDCMSCDESGGICGSNSTFGFVCHCRDGRTVDISGPAVCDGANIKTSGIGQTRKFVIAATAAVGTISLACAFLIFWFRKKTSLYNSMFFWRKSTAVNDKVEAFFKNYGSLVPKRYTYSSIKKATDSFRERLGQGGYGGVYKGKLLDGRLVAVKLLNETKGTNGEEFINEVVSISRTSHVNVVSLLGFCLEGSKRALVYEYMASGSLDKFIRNKKPHEGMGSELEWNTLLKIVIGIARGLEYLHCGCGTRIFHFDIKPHNILLDEEFCPKISDFGLAKLCPNKASNVSMLGARGTIGYIAPEMFSSHFGKVSHKADVYSYGMLVLEMVGVRENTDECVKESSEFYFPHFIYKKLEWCNGEIGIRGIKSMEDEEIARKMIVVGLWCIRSLPSERPAMSKVIEMLEGNLQSLQAPPQEPFLLSPLMSIIDSSSKSESQKESTIQAY